MIGKHNSDNREGKRKVRDLLNTVPGTKNNVAWKAQSFTVKMERKLEYKFKYCPY